MHRARIISSRPWGPEECGGANEAGSAVACWRPGNGCIHEGRNTPRCLLCDFCRGSGGECHSTCSAEDDITHALIHHGDRARTTSEATAASASSHGSFYGAEADRSAPRRGSLRTGLGEGILPTRIRRQDEGRRMEARTGSGKRRRSQWNDSILDKRHKYGRRWRCGFCPYHNLCNNAHFPIDEDEEDVNGAHCGMDNGLGSRRSSRRCGKHPSVKLCNNVDSIPGRHQWQQLQWRGRRFGSSRRVRLCTNADTARGNCWTVAEEGNGGEKVEGAMRCSTVVDDKVEESNARRPRGRDGAGEKGSVRPRDGGGGGREMDAQQHAQGTSHHHGQHDQDTTCLEEKEACTHLRETFDIRHGRFVFVMGPNLPCDYMSRDGRGRRRDGNGTTKPQHSPTSSTPAHQRSEPAEDGSGRKPRMPPAQNKPTGINGGRGTTGTAARTCDDGGCCGPMSGSGCRDKGGKHDDRDDARDACVCRPRCPRDPRHDVEMTRRGRERGRSRRSVREGAKTAGTRRRDGARHSNRERRRTSGPPYVAARSSGNAHGLADRITARQAVKLGRGANLADLDLGQLAKCDHVFGYESYQPPT